MNKRLVSVNTIQFVSCPCLWFNKSVFHSFSLSNKIIIRIEKEIRLRNLSYMNKLTLVCTNLSIRFRDDHAKMCAFYPKEFKQSSYFECQTKENFTIMINIILSVSFGSVFEPYLL